YIIRSNGSPTAVIDQGVFVILMDLEATNWVVEAVPQHGENSYMYVNPNCLQYCYQGYKTYYLLYNITTSDCRVG
ncbi:hypothetical protein F5050DRAFT_1570840, partial [Lentinula boryana]